MKVIREEDKNSNVYITKFTTERGKRSKSIDKGMFLKKDTEDYNELVVYMADGSKPRYENVPEHKHGLAYLIYNVNPDHELIEAIHAPTQQDHLAQ